MSETGRPTLDLLLLLLMKEDFTVTPYELLRHLGISPVASIPALKRLKKKELVQSDPAGPRGRQAFKATDQGEKVLRSEMVGVLQREVEKLPLDAESFSRILALSYSSYGHPLFAVRMMEPAIEKCMKRMAAAEQKLPPLEAKAHRGSLEERYLWSLTTLEVAHWRARAAGLKRLYRHMVTRGYRARKGAPPPPRKRAQKP